MNDYSGYLVVAVIMLAVAFLIIAIELMWRTTSRHVHIHLDGDDAKAVQRVVATRPPEPQLPARDRRMLSGPAPETRRGIVRTGDTPQGMADAWRFSPVATYTLIAPDTLLVEYTDPQGAENDDGGLDEW